jgi:hypothetical protein
VPEYRLPRLRPTVRLGVSAVLLTVSLAASLRASATGQAAAVDPWIARTNSVSFQPQQAPDAPVRVDLPKKDWMVLPASGSMLLVMASRKGDAVVLVEGAVLRQALEPADVTDVFAQIEIDAIKQRQPKAAEFQARVLTLGERRLVAIQYSRPGVLGAERVRQYSMPNGTQLYRVSCISSAALFSVYDAVFSHMAASLTASP